jgi:hypothetical protein
MDSENLTRVKMVACCWRILTSNEYWAAMDMDQSRTTEVTQAELKLLEALREYPLFC